MDEFIKALVDNSSNITVNGLFLLAVIICLLWLFFIFLFKMFKYYWENIRSEKKQEYEGKDSFQMIVELHDKIGTITAEYAGKYATRDEIRSLSNKIENIKEDVLKIKTERETERERERDDR